jgi:hypothetical protein
MTTIIEINGFAIYQDRATKIWIVRDRAARKEVAHEPTKEMALKAARAISAR